MHVKTHKHVMPMAEVSFVAIPPIPEYVQSLPLVDTWYPVAAAVSLLSNNSEMDVPLFEVHANGYSLTYLGRPAMFHTAFSGTCSVDRKQEFALGLAVNDVLVNSSYTQNNWPSKNVHISFAFHAVLSLQAGDRVNMISKCLGLGSRQMSWRNVNFVCISHDMVRKRM